MRTIEIPADALPAPGGRASWDATPHVRELLAASPAPGAILVVLGAKGCHGCDVLAAQLASHGAALGDGAEILDAVAGDFPSGRHATELRIGHASFAAPGIPLSVLFRPAGKAKLDFLSLLLGPLDERRPAEALASLRAGRSQWVPEAEGARIAVCVGSLCFSLDASNAFRQPFSIILKDTP